MADQLHSTPTEGSTTVRLHGTSPFPGNTFISMNSHVHDAFSTMTCQADPGLKSTLKEGSTTVFFQETFLPGQLWVSLAGYSYLLTTYESSLPWSASMVTHCWRAFANPSSMEAHRSEFHVATSLTTHCHFKWSPRAAEARSAAGCRKRRGIKLEGGEGRKRRKLDESDLQAGLVFFSSFEPQIECSTSMLAHTSQQLASHQQGVSMVAHCATYSSHQVSSHQQVLSMVAHCVTDSFLEQVSSHQHGVSIVHTASHTPSQVAAYRSSSLASFL